jgi:hypothetical protein
MKKKSLKIYIKQERNFSFLELESINIFCENEEFLAVVKGK